MYSIDDKTLQALSNINALFDFVKNPDAYKSLVNEYQSAAFEYQKSYKELTGAQDIKTFYDTSMAAIEKAKDDLKEAQKSFDSTSEKTKKQISDKSNTVSERETAVQQKEQELNKLESDLKVATSNVVLKQAGVDQAYQQIQAAKDNLVARESALAEKAEKIKALVG